MAQVVIVEQGFANEDSERTSAIAQAQGFTTIARVNASVRNADLVAALREISAKSPSEDLLIISAQAWQSNAQLGSILGELAAGNGFAFASIRQGEFRIDLPATSADIFQVDRLVAAIEDGVQIPALAFTIPAQYCNDEMLPGAESLAELAFRAFLIANTNGEEIQFSDRELESSAKFTLTLSQQSAVNILQVSLSLFNIEELFPHHPWRSHEAESAAACCHTLAARFMNLGSYAAALECLDRSDALEKSPRAFALRALIARKRGDTLGAIADMISSLQTYENRKKSDGEHYLKFAPEDFDPINSSLKSGLSALNQQQNDQALDFFTKAVFAFDPFYRDAGIR